MAETAVSLIQGMHPPYVPRISFRETRAVLGKPIRAAGSDRHFSTANQLPLFRWSALKFRPSELDQRQLATITYIHAMHECMLLDSVAGESQRGRRSSALYGRTATVTMGKLSLSSVLVFLAESGLQFTAPSTGGRSRKRSSQCSPFLPSTHHSSPWG